MGVNIHKNPLKGKTATKKNCISPVFFLHAFPPVVGRSSPKWHLAQGSETDLQI